MPIYRASNHILQERWSALVDKKLRAIVEVAGHFSKKYEGSPKAGVVKIPIRNMEVTMRDYDRDEGIKLEGSSTSYLNLEIVNDKAFNEIIDGFNAAAVPDNLVADRLDSIGYTTAKVLDDDAVRVLKQDGTLSTNTDPIVVGGDKIWIELLNAVAKLQENNIYKEKMKIVVTPTIYAAVLADNKFLGASSDVALGARRSGINSQVDGVPIIKSNNLGTVYNLGYDNTTANGRKAGSGALKKVQYIIFNTEFAHLVEEWSIKPTLNDLSQSGTYIGASSITARRIWGIRTSKNGKYVAGTGIDAGKMIWVEDTSLRPKSLKTTNTTFDDKGYGNTGNSNNITILVRFDKT